MKFTITTITCLAAVVLASLSSAMPANSHPDKQLAQQTGVTVSSHEAFTAKCSVKGTHCVSIDPYNKRDETGYELYSITPLGKTTGICSKKYEMDTKTRAAGAIAFTGKCVSHGDSGWHVKCTSDDSYVNVHFHDGKTVFNAVGAAKAKFDLNKSYRSGKHVLAKEMTVFVKCPN